MREIDTNLLRAFLAVLDTGNFSRAARQLNRTQSALSMQIRRLEEVLNATVFERSSRPVVPTVTGELLAPYAREILALNDSVVEMARSKQIGGRVKLGIMEDYAAAILPPVLNRFLASNPNVQVEVYTGLTGKLLEDLGTKYDIVIAMLPQGTLEGELMFSGRPVWAASEGFQVVEGAELPLALYHQGCLFRKWATQLLDQAGLRWRITMTSSSIGAIASTLKHGKAVSVFKENNIPDGVIVLSDASPLPRLPSFEIRLFRAPRSRTGAASALADYLLAHLLPGPGRKSASVGQPQVSPATAQEASQEQHISLMLTR